MWFQVSISEREYNNNENRPKYVVENFIEIGHIE
jgi:hypothetical protein